MTTPCYKKKKGVCVGPDCKWIVSKGCQSTEGTKATKPKKVKKVLGPTPKAPAPSPRSPTPKAPTPKVAPKRKYESKCKTDLAKCEDKKSEVTKALKGDVTEVMHKLKNVQKIHQDEKEKMKTEFDKAIKAHMKLAGDLNRRTLDLTQRLSVTEGRLKSCNRDLDLKYKELKSAEKKLEKPHGWL